MTYPFLNQAAEALRPIHKAAMAAGDHQSVSEAGTIASLILALEMLAQNEDQQQFEGEAAAVTVATQSIFGVDQWLAEMMRLIAHFEGKPEAAKIGASFPQPPARLANTDFYRTLSKHLNLH